MRVQPFFQPRLDPVRRRPQVHRARLHRLGEQELDPDERHENEAEQLHRRLHVALGEEGGKTGEGDEAVDDLHDRRAQADQRRPFESAPRPLVQDRQVDRPDRNGEQQAADQACQTGKPE